MLTSPLFQPLFALPDVVTFKSFIVGGVLSNFAVYELCSDVFLFVLSETYAKIVDLPAVSIGISTSVPFTSCHVPSPLPGLRIYIIYDIMYFRCFFICRSYCNF